LPALHVRGQQEILLGGEEVTRPGEIICRWKGKKAKRKQRSKVLESGKPATKSGPRKWLLLLAFLDDSESSRANYGKSQAGMATEEERSTNFGTCRESGGP